MRAGRRGVRRRAAVPAGRAAARARLRRHPASSPAPTRPTCCPPWRHVARPGRSRSSPATARSATTGAVADVLDEVLDAGQRRRRLRRRPRRDPARRRRRRRAGAAPGARSRSRRRCPARTGLCQGCAVPVVGEDGVGRLVRACADGPVFRGDRVRWDDLEAARGDVSVELAGLTLANPVWSPPAAAAPAASSRRTPTSTGSAASSPARSPSTPAPGGRPPRIVETPVRAGQRRRPAEPRPRPLPRHRAAVAGAARRARLRVDRRPVAGGVRRARAPARPRRPGVAGIEVNLSAPDAAGTDVFDVREPFHAAARRGRRPPRPARAACRCSPSSAPTWSASSRARARSLDAGAAAVVVGNALPAAMPDGRPGGLSGPAIRPLALRCVAEVRAALPGGAASSAAAASPTPHDARAFLDAGATAVQIGTALLHDPTTATPRLRGRPQRGERQHDRSAPDVARRHRASAGRSAPASTRTRALLRDWGLDDDVAGLERFALDRRRGGGAVRLAS